MTIYLSSYILICLNSLIALKFKNKESLFWFFSIFILIFLNAAKWNIGGDWWAYYDYTIIAKKRGFLELLNVSEPGFMAVTWISSNLNLDLPGINFFASVIFFLGFHRLIKNEDYRWLALLITVPLIYFITFQGYLRQGIALGFIFIAFSYLKENKNYYFLFYVFIAFLFHRTAIFCLIFYFSDFYLFRKFFKKILIISILLLLIFILYTFVPFIKIEINNIIQRFYNDIFFYITKHLRFSVGAIPRGIINLLPVIIFFLFFNKFKKYKDFSILVSLSLVTIILFLFSFFYSTVADRLAVYVCVLQILIYPRFIKLLENDFIKYTLSLIIVLFYLFLFIFYLAYADNGNQYSNYQIYFSRDVPVECQLLSNEECR